MTRCFRVKEIFLCLACQTSVPVSSPFSLFSRGGSHMLKVVLYMLKQWRADCIVQYPIAMYLWVESS